MIVDANVLLYVEDESSPHHAPAVRWLMNALNGPVRIGLPWQSLLAFVRIRTHPRVYEHPLPPTEAWARVTEWLAAPAAWVPTPTEGHADVLGRLVLQLRTELENGEDLEPRARRIVERMALALQASLLVRHAPADLADAFCAARLTSEGGHEYGTLPPTIDTATIIARHAPHLN